MAGEKCPNGRHEWTHQYGDDWTPDYGTPCDCGGKKWGVPLTITREHIWEFYANGTFCKVCGTAIGSGTTCR